MYLHRNMVHTRNNCATMLHSALLEEGTEHSKMSNLQKTPVQ